MKLTESDIINLVKRVLKEYHEGQQLILPFDGSSEPHNWMQFIEWLESHGTYGKLPSQPNAMEDVLTNSMLFSIGESTFFYGTGEEFDGDYFYEIFSEFVKANGGNTLFANPNSTVDEIVDEIDSPNDVLYYLNEQAQTTWYNFIVNRGRETMDWWMEHRFDIDEDGLIYCERMIAIEKANERYHGEEDGFDYYQTLDDQYTGIGEYWSYAKGGGQVYFNKTRSPQDVLVKGRVSPKDVDWTATISLDSMDEQELRLDYGAKVQIDEITTWDEESGGLVRLPLKGSLIIGI